MTDFLYASFEAKYVALELEARREELDKSKNDAGRQLAKLLGIKDASHLIACYERGFPYGTPSSDSIRTQGEVHMDRLARYIQMLDFDEPRCSQLVSHISVFHPAFRYPPAAGESILHPRAIGGLLRAG